MRPKLTVTRAQILAFRRRVQALDKRLAPSATSLRAAAWAGLQDSVPRSALLSIHARVDRTHPSSWEDPSLVQLWGPRFTTYVVPRRDVAVFSLARLPDDAGGRQRALDLAERLQAPMYGRKMTDTAAGRLIGVRVTNELRYAGATGAVLIRWEGAKAPTIWTIPAPEVDPQEARMELARRYLHVFGPTSAEAFGRWAGIKPPGALATFDALGPSMTAVRTPIGDGWILREDVRTMRAAPRPPAPARLLPSGDPYFLLWGADRALVVPKADRRDALWTTRVWPGALMLGGELLGTWRRANAAFTVQPWRRLSRGEREAIHAEVDAMPLRGVGARIINWG